MQPPLWKSASAEISNLYFLEHGLRTPSHRAPDLLFVASSRLVTEPWCLANWWGGEEWRWGGKRKKEGEERGMHSNDEYL